MIPSGREQKNFNAPDADGRTPSIESQIRCTAPDIQRLKKRLV
jgi:hypothetical protein